MLGQMPMPDEKNQLDEIHDREEAEQNNNKSFEEMRRRAIATVTWSGLVIESMQAICIFVLGVLEFEFLTNPKQFGLIDATFPVLITGLAIITLLILFYFIDGILRFVESFKITPIPVEKAPIKKIRGISKRKMRIAFIVGAISILSIIAIISFTIFTSGPNIVVVSFTHNTVIAQTIFSGSLKNIGSREGSGALHFAIDIGSNWHLEAHEHFSDIQPDETRNFNEILQTTSVMDISNAAFSCWFVVGEL